MLVDVSDIVSIAVGDTNYLMAGMWDFYYSYTPPPYAQTGYEMVTLTYNATFAGSLYFTVTGLATVTTKTTAPSARTGEYVETDSFSLQDGTGQGQDTAGENIMLTGITITASGSAAQSQ
jgi:hypothetical protein